MSHDTMLSREAAVVRRKHEEKVDDDLDTAIFAPAYERALSAGEKRSLYAEQMAPLWRQLEENPAATSAEKKLRQRIKTDIEAVKPHRKIRTGGSSSSFDIAPGTSFFTPPYDYARPGPSQGPVTMTPDPAAGTVYVYAGFDSDWDGARAGSAAVGLGLEFLSQGLAIVRPYVEYEFALAVGGNVFSAYAEAHIGFLVNADDGTLVSNIQDCPLAEWEPHTPTYAEGRGVLRAPFQEVRFLAEAHHRYRFWLWATVAGDQSGEGHAFGSSHMAGRVTAYVPFVSVEVQ